MTKSGQTTRRTAGWAVAAAILSGAWTAAGASAIAAPKIEAQQAAVVKAITDCRSIENLEARVACYDKAVDEFNKADAKGQVIVVDREQVQAVRKQAFGFNIPSIAIFSKGAKPEELDRITIELRAAHQGRDGKWVMISKDDAVWRQTDDETLALDPHPGSSLTVVNGVLGTFFCSVDHQIRIRCMRER